MKSRESSQESQAHGLVPGGAPIPHAPRLSRRERIKAELHEGRNRTPAQVGSETMRLLLHLGAPIWKAGEMSAELGLHAASKPPRSPGGKRRICRRAASEVMKAIGDELERFSDTRAQQACATTFQTRREPHRHARSSRRGARRHTTRAGPRSDDPDDPEPADLAAGSRRHRSKAVAHGD